jgi:hypothetical protein
MRRPYRFLFLSVATVVVGLAAGVYMVWPRTAITVGNAKRITEGMTLVEVEAVLGGPARDESGGAGFVFDEPPDGQIGHDFAQWHGPERGVHVEFRNGRVALVRTSARIWDDETLLRRLFRWLGL